MIELDINKIKDLYDEGMSLRQIAKILNTSDANIRNRMLKYRIPRRKPTQKREVDINTIIELYNQGKSTIDISKQFGTSHTRVIKEMKTYNITRRTKKEANAKYLRYNICVVCGKSFHPFGSIYRLTCTDKCHYIWMEQYRYNPKNIKHGGSQSRYQRIARTLKEQRCEMCMVAGIQLDVHHIDKNHANNNIENIMILCTSCHSKYHYNNGDSRIQGAPTHANII